MTRPSRGLLHGACAAIALVAACSPARTARTVRPAPPQLGQQLELAAVDLAGRELDPGAEQGKVRIVEFWASWCEPCRDAMPHLDALARDLGPRGLAVYAVSFDEDRAQVVQFLEQTPVGFPVLWDKGGDQFSSRYEVNRLPTTLVIDRRGVIRFVQDGWSAAKARAAREQIEKLLDEPS
jgi:thiol-disulfide isomerase/thioredoxin